VHSQGGRADFFARLAAKKAGIKCISTIAMPVEGYDAPLIRKCLYIILDRYSERFVDKFVVVSENLRRTLVKKHRVAPRRIATIPNGIEIHSYCSMQTPASKLRREFNLSPPTVLIGAAGRLVWQKGMEYFIRAAKKISQERPNVRFFIIGSGPLRRRLQGLAARLGLGKEVIFTGFRVDMKEVLLELDIVVLPSLREGQPLLLLEAMALARPIVASRIPGIVCTIRHNETGILIPPKNVHSLYEAVSLLLGDENKRIELGRQARKTACDLYDMADKIAQYERLYLELAHTEKGVF